MIMKRAVTGRSVTVFIKPTITVYQRLTEYSSGSDDVFRVEYQF